MPVCCRLGNQPLYTVLPCIYTSGIASKLAHCSLYCVWCYLSFLIFCPNIWRSLWINWKSKNGIVIFVSSVQLQIWIMLSFDSVNLQHWNTRTRRFFSGFDFVLNTPLAIIILCIQYRYYPSYSVLSHMLDA